MFYKKNEEQKVYRTFVKTNIANGSLVGNSVYSDCYCNTPLLPRNNILELCKLCYTFNWAADLEEIKKLKNSV